MITSAHFCWIIFTTSASAGKSFSIARADSCRVESPNSTPRSQSEEKNLNRGTRCFEYQSVERQQSIYYYWFELFVITIFTGKIDPRLFIISISCKIYKQDRKVK